MTSARAKVRTVLLALAWLAWARVLWLTVFYPQMDGTAPRLETAWFWFLGLAIFLNAIGPRAAGDRQSPPRPVSPTREATILLVSIAASFLLYSPALGIGLLSDDFVLLDRAANGQYLASDQNPFIRPVPLLIWSLIQASGLPVAVTAHALNVALHGVNGYLVLRLSRAWGIDGGYVWIPSALFLAFAAHSEAVVWISGLQDVLMTTFVLLTVVLAMSAPHTRVGIGLVGLFSALALFTKETAVALPLLLVAAVPSPTRLRTALKGSALAIGSVTLAYGAWRVLTDHAAAIGWPTSRYEVKEMVVRPWASLGAPWSGAALGAYPWMWIASCVVPFVAVALLRGRAMPQDCRARLGGAAIWVFAAVAPLGTWLAVEANLEGARYLYLPSVGWVILLVLGLIQVQRSLPWGRHIAITALAFLLAVQIFALRVQLQPWRDAALLRERVLEGALAVGATTGCQSVAFRNPPDVVGGAYVFRNGLEEALNARGIVGGSPTSGSCLLEWREGRWWPASAP